MKSCLKRQLYYFSLRFSHFPIKLPTPQGWLTVPTYMGGFSYAFNRPSEKAIQQHFTLKKDDVVFDVGANIGWYSLIAGKKVGEEGKVIAIEPEPRNFQLLCKNICDCKRSNIKPIECAASNKDGYAKLTLERSPAGHSIIHSVNPHTITVTTKTLDTLTRNNQLDHVDFIKIDVEGAEHLVLRGAKTTLKQHHPKIIAETTPTSRIHSFLQTLGYCKKRLTENDWFYN